MDAPAQMRSGRQSRGARVSPFVSCGGAPPACGGKAAVCGGALRRDGRACRTRGRGGARLPRRARGGGAGGIPRGAGGAGGIRARRCGIPVFLSALGAEKRERRGAPSLCRPPRHGAARSGHHRNGGGGKAALPRVGGDHQRGVRAGVLHGGLRQRAPRRGVPRRPQDVPERLDPDPDRAPRCRWQHRRRWQRRRLVLARAGAARKPAHGCAVPADRGVLCHGAARHRLARPAPRRGIRSPFRPRSRRAPTASPCGAPDMRSGA